MTGTSFTDKTGKEMKFPTFLLARGRLYLLWRNLTEAETKLFETLHCSPVAGQMEEPYAICQLEMTVAGTVIHTDWIQWSSNCSDIPQAAASFRVPLQATLKAIFYARHSLGVPEGYKIIYNRLCFKTGQVVIQHMEDIKSDHCPVSYTSSNSRSFAALPPCKQTLTSPLDQSFSANYSSV